MSQELADLLSKRFITRSDVKAIQLDRNIGNLHQGDWFPDIRVDPIKRPNSPHLPHGFKRRHLLAHLAGEATYGHYMLGKDSTTKLFAFDIDLKKEGTWARMPTQDDIPFAIYGDDEKIEKFLSNEMSVHHVGERADQGHVDRRNLRDVWQSRKKQDADARTWLKYQMKMIAHMLAAKTTELGLDCAVAYSGSKGVHVYGFMPKPTYAKDVRDAAFLVMEQVGEFDQLKGKHFFQHKNDDPIHGFQNFTVEVFPKQDSLEDKSLGNLMRLPLGRNQQAPNNPTFFVDMTSPLAELKPHLDPVRLLTEGKCFV